MKLDSKADNIRALAMGLFGNAPIQFDSLEEIAEAVDRGEIDACQPMVVRPRAAGGRCWYDVSVMGWFLDHSMESGFDASRYYFNLPIDKSSVTLNAEVTRSADHLEMTYATVQDHMRPALAKHGRRATGLTAEMILRHFCCDRGYETIKDLLDMYPDHVVEFTCMNRPYGTLGWGTVVWEVRSY